MGEFEMSPKILAVVVAVVLASWGLLYGFTVLVVGLFS